MRNKAPAGFAWKRETVRDPADGEMSRAGFGRTDAPHPALREKGQGAASRSRAAAASGVRSRCGEPSISNPTMNFLIVAERRSGG
jgi:hypothetical protein